MIERARHQENIPCNIYPLYSKTGVCRGISIFFLFLLQNIDCGYSLEPPRRGGSNVHPQFMFGSKNKKNIKFFLMKFSIFTGEKNLCILHGQVFVMATAWNNGIGMP